jgi:phage gp46-like protein
MDIAVVWDSRQLRADWQVVAGDLARDEGGLRSAIALSLFTDRLAREDDALPDGAGTDRRGWWGDMPASPDAEPDPIGSRLWLLARSKRTEETRRRAEQCATEALAWILRDGVASAVDVAAEWGGERLDQLRLTVTLRRGAQGDVTFDFAWAAEGIA